MSKRTLCIILGLWVAIVPFFGVPFEWKKWILVVSGLLIALVSFIRVKKQIVENPPLE